MTGNTSIQRVHSLDVLHICKHVQNVHMKHIYLYLSIQIQRQRFNDVSLSISTLDVNRHLMHVSLEKHVYGTSNGVCNKQCNICFSILVATTKALKGHLEMIAKHSHV